MVDVYSKIKLVHHPEKIRALAQGEITSPIYVRVKPTNRCNHHCFFCGYDKDDRRTLIDRFSEIPKEKMLEILSDFKEMGVKAVTYSGGGEPLIYPDICEALEKTLEYGIDLSMITNGQELSGRAAELLGKAQWVRISSDAIDAKSFSKTRGVPEEFFYILNDNIKSFAKTKSKECELGINLVVTKKNIDEIYYSVKRFKELGANHVKVSPKWDMDFIDYHGPIKEKAIEQIEMARKDFSSESFRVVDTYESDFNNCYVLNRPYPKCFVMQTVPVIGADCKVYFCHDKAYDPNGTLGSIRKISFKELWFSEQAKKIFKEFDPRIGCVHHCANDLKNIRISELISKGSNLEGACKEERHKNFV